MGDGISFDLGSAVPYIIDRTLAVFGKDAASAEWKVNVERIVRLSVEQASTVQCVGMARPIPIADIYQTTRLLAPPPSSSKSPHEVAASGELSILGVPPYEPDGRYGRTPNEREIDVNRLIEEGVDAVIFAGPGWGKTTLLHWVYSQLCQNTEYAPMLFTLRRPEAIDSLLSVVDRLEHEKGLGHPKGARIVVLVDGYDEVSHEKRQEVSGLLMRFRSLSRGRFYLTCRAHYDIYDLKAIHCRIAPFSEYDSPGYIRAFSRAYGCPIDADSLLAELKEHGFQDFAAHPLMLALVCILKTGPNKEIPRRAIGLIRRAIETLTFRWDEAKYIHRGSGILLDGDERVRCLMRIAFEMKELQAESSRVEASARRHLELLQLRNIDVKVLLTEIAQWYGLFVPIDSDKWQFVHRTIGDYFYARFWVESGKFARARDTRAWDIRGAYATCLLPEGTAQMAQMLLDPVGMSAFCECLYNMAAFDPTVISNAVIGRIERLTPTIVKLRKNEVAADLKEDFFSVAADGFLRTLIVVGSARASDAGNAVALYALSEIAIRRQRIERDLLRGKLSAVYNSSPDLRVEIVNRKRSAVAKTDPFKFKLSDVLKPS